MSLKSSLKYQLNLYGLLRDKGPIHTKYFCTQYRDKKIMQKR